jgi:hypothetical protein
MGYLYSIYSIGMMYEIYFYHDVAYLHQLSFCFNIHVMKQPVLRRVTYCCLPLTIEGEWCLQCEN